MFLQISNLLTEEGLLLISNTINTATFVDGKTTAYGAAQQVKNNLQLHRESKEAQFINQIIEKSLQHNVLFKDALLIKQILPFLINKYKTGNEYGWHVDSSFIYVHPAQIRCNLCMIIFLKVPETYEGGALELETTLRLQQVKLAAGHAFVYLTNCIHKHKVQPIISGTRLVVVSWVERFVKDNEEKQLLKQTNQLEQYVAQLNMNSNTYLLTQQLHNNLLKKWSA